jgi:hypothetical protein
MNDLPSPTTVTYDVARTAFKAKQFLDQVRTSPIFAADFEVAIKYTSDEIEEWKRLLQKAELTKLERVSLESRLAATALDHPSHCTITHCSIATSDSHAYVFILDNPSITNYVLNFLVTTLQQQVWHNASYDFRHLYYYIGKFPINYEDSQILAKCLINHVEIYKARTGLKELAGTWYGAWGISADCFTLAQIYEPHVLHYAAIDACATYKLWNFLQDECNSIDTLITSPLTEPPEAPY